MTTLDTAHRDQPTLVTGCSSGIGRAIALGLAECGFRVYATARRIDSIEDLADAGCHVLELDVTDPDARAACLSRIEAEAGPVAHLVNNAGYGQHGPFEEVPLDAFRAQFETNLFAVVALCQRVLPGMRAAGYGRIVNVSSMGGRLSFPGGAAYHASKYALEAMSDVLRFEVAGLGIDVVVVDPGPVASAFGEAALASLDRLEPATPAPEIPAATNDERFDPYAELRAGIRTALASTFESPGPGTAEPTDVADAVASALRADRPEPRVVVGDAARTLLARHAASSERDWDEFVGTLYPAPKKQATLG